ncbi:MAG: class I SAM-dependent methyltransferase [Methylococcales bacterium]|nr:class I SAM-dependent methyltransferase [Methylococcales bacterium]
MGKDAFILASLGCQVTIIERSPILYALLFDALKRAQQDLSTESIVKNIQLINADSKQLIASDFFLLNNQAIDVIYMDPMYPKRNKSAKVKKEMQIIQKLVGKDEDSADLFEICLNIATKVVVKRPKTAQPITQKKADYNVVNKNTRYDVYLGTVRT